MPRTLPILLLLLAATSAGAQTPTGSVPLYDNLGAYARPISTTSPEAQRYFDQGMRLTYGFGHEEAVRSFREAIRRDPQCAMCYWGVAWALGPYINARMDSISGVQAFQAIRRAVELRRHATAMEQALIDAMATRYARVPTSRNRPGLDSAYARAMREVSRRHPEDLDAATLHAEALMVLRPWDQWTRSGEPKPGTEEVVAVLERVLARDIRHPGACHLYIHAVEASRAPERAEACAELLGDAIPGASHIPHMPSHIYMRIGRYGDAVRANQRAWHVDLQAAYGGPPGIYPSHNLHMLLTAAAMDGQSAVAIQAARDLERRFPSHAFYPVLALVRFGRWEEVLERREPATDRFHQGIWRFGRGLALLAAGGTDSARVQLEALESILSELPEAARFRGHPQRSILGIARGILAGELAAAAGRHDEAVRHLREALPLEDSLTYDEPEPWPIPLRQVLGGVLLEAGRAAEAEQVYREELRVHPRNGWSLFGLERSLRARGRIAEAEEAGRRFAEAWARSDVWLLSSRFPPRRPGGVAKASAQGH